MEQLKSPFARMIFGEYLLTVFPASTLHFYPLKTGKSARLFPVEGEGTREKKPKSEWQSSVCLVKREKHDKFAYRELNLLSTYDE
jgi:hypothetical protein